MKPTFPKYMRACIALTMTGIITLFTVSLPIAHAGDVGNPTGPRPGAQGWLAAPLTIPLSAVPKWALQAAQTSVTTLPSDPHFQQDVADMAIRIYQTCLSLKNRCHPPTLAQGQGLSTGGSFQTTGAIQPDVPSGSPYDGTAGTAYDIMTNQTPAAAGANTTDLIEPNGQGYVNYCGPGSARVAAYSYDGFLGYTANSFSWYASNVLGFSSGSGTPYNANLVAPINSDLASKGWFAEYGASLSHDPNPSVLQSHIGGSIYQKHAPMIISGSTQYLVSWGTPPNSTNVAHIVALYSYDFTNGQSNVTYDDTANAAYAGNQTMGPIPTTIGLIWKSMSTCTPTPGCGDEDVDVW